MSSLRGRLIASNIAKITPFLPNSQIELCLKHIHPLSNVAEQAQQGRSALATSRCDPAHLSCHTPEQAPAHIDTAEKYFRQERALPVLEPKKKNYVDCGKSSGLYWERIQFMYSMKDDLFGPGLSSHLDLRQSFCLFGRNKPQSVAHRRLQAPTRCRARISCSFYTPADTNPELSSALSDPSVG
ncbi:hypothetical protein BGY98DRAFT_307082 [Russula aff. rugulosa BPL654]|nr:hypothetical protein BGY98DRAFT_307082 [Russula aff. rugulosa BPL654]